MIARSRNVKFTSARVVAVEPLETRRLLSASMGGGGNGGAAVPTAEVQAGLLHIVGTKGADLIVIGVNYTDPSGAPMVDVRVNDSLVGSFLLQDVTRGVEVYAGKGDDTVRFDESAGLVPLSLRAFGEQGDDTLVGSFLDDELYGGAGNDSLNGNDGNDSLFGDQGKDLIAGGGGDDLADGGNGCDELYGEAGDDALTGANGADVLDGGDGNDALDGGRGADSVSGGLGADLFAASDRPAEILDKADDDTHEFVSNGAKKRAAR